MRPTDLALLLSNAVGRVVKAATLLRSLVGCRHIAAAAVANHFVTQRVLCLLVTERFVWFRSRSQPFVSSTRAPTRAIVRRKSVTITKINNKHHQQQRLTAKTCASVGICRSILATVSASDPQQNSPNRRRRILQRFQRQTEQDREKIFLG